jgi:alpha-tubulin suppressor-like RCC1 family protein
MFGSSVAARFRPCAVAVAVMLVTTALLQVGATAPAAAAGSSVGVFAWGDNTYGQLGNGSSTGPDICNGSSPCGTTPAPVLLPAGVSPTAIAGGGQFALAIGSDGHLYAWGSALGLGNGDTTNSDTPVVVPLPSGVTPTAVAAGEQTGYAIGSDGTLYAWGNNIVGQLGDGTSSVAPTFLPVVVSFPSGVTPKAVAAGGDFAVAIGSDGKLYAWGDNQTGELGNGTNTGPDACAPPQFACGTTPAPVLLPSGVTPTAIAGGFGTAYALGSDGKLYAWGEDSLGELGNGSSTSPDTCNVPMAVPMAIPCGTTPAPVLLPSGVTFSAIAAGSQTAYAIGSNTKLYAWGDSSFGKLGNGTSSGAGDSTPAPVLLPSGVAPTAIAGGAFNAYALGSDGKLYAWGDNQDGELGNGTGTGSASTPVAVPLPSGSILQKLGPQELASGGYAIVNAPDVAPSITTQPTNQTLFAGQNATFSAAASGFPAPTVQWQVSTDGGVTFSPVPGATDTTLTISDTTVAESGNEYEAVFSNSSSSTPTDVADLTVNPDVAPSITTQPTNQTLFAGQDAAFNAAAGGFPAPTVQWQVSSDGGVTFSPVPGATQTTLTISDTTVAESGNEYEAVFTNSVSSATTDAATLTVNPDIAPAITTQPLDQSVYAGTSAAFTAAASGTPTPTVEWQVSVDGGVTWDDTGVTSTSISGMPTAFVNGWELRAVFTNGGGSATTNAATLSVLPDIAPVVTIEPLNQSVASGGTATFTAAASGTPTPTVQWQVSVDGGVTWDDTGVTSTTISGMPTAFVNGWELRAVFTNGGGSATTNAATLTVTE